MIPPRALDFVLAAEGGYVNDPDDPGGATNFGVTQRTYDEWSDGNGRLRRDVRTITLEDCDSIYEKMYWRAAGCDSLEWPMSLVIFDCAVNQGAGTARLVATAAHGLGPDSAVAIRKYIYRRLVAQNEKLGKFIAGWMNRLEALRKVYA